MIQYETRYVLHDDSSTDELLQSFVNGLGKHTHPRRRYDV